MASPTFVPPLGAPPSPGITASSFTPSGLGPLRRASTARDPLRVRMSAAAAAFHPSSSSAAAAAALRAAGGVDPRSHHVASVLSRATAAGTLRDAASSSTPTDAPRVAYATAAGGGVVGGDAAVAADSAAKSRAWAATMAALRSAGVADLGSASPASAPRPSAVGRTPAATAPTSAVSRPVSVMVAGAPRVAVSSYASRMARLSDHAASVSASMEAEAAAVEEASTVVARPSMGAALLAAVSGAVSPRAAPEVVSAPAQAKVNSPPPVNGAAVTRPAEAESRSVDREPVITPPRSSTVAPSNPTSARTPVGAWSFGQAIAPSLVLATASPGGSAASTPLPTPLPSTMASFVAAKSPEEPEEEEDIEEADETVSSTMRAVLPPVLTAAFVGACLALSHAGAVIGSVMTPM